MCPVVRDAPVFIASIDRATFSYEGATLESRQKPQSVCLLLSSTVKRPHRSPLCSTSIPINPSRGQMTNRPREAVRSQVVDYRDKAASIYGAGKEVSLLRHEWSILECFAETRDPLVLRRGERIKRGPDTDAAAGAIGSFHHR